MHYFGHSSDSSALVMDLMGPSLEDLFNKCGRKFSLKTVLLLAEQMVKRIEYIHFKNFIHRYFSIISFRYLEILSRIILSWVLVSILDMFICSILASLKDTEIQKRSITYHMLTRKVLLVPHDMQA